MISATGVARWKYRSRYLDGGGVGLGLGGGVTGQLHSVAVGHVLRSVELVRSE